jgi:ABC-type transport system involved in multi-copper enzyme maturation permease subunit
MSTPASTVTVHNPLATVDGRPTSLPRVLRSEWIKTRTLRSTWITLGSIVLVIVALGIISAMVASGDITPQGGPGPGRARSLGPLSTVLAGANLAVLIVAVMGSIAGAREFSTGMIRTTFSAVPKRLPVLWSKLITFTAVVLPIVAISVVATFFLGMRVLDRGGAATVAWSDDGVARSVLGTAYYIVGLGLIGLAIGILLRSTAASIGVVIGAVIFLPALASALLPSSWDEVLKYLPSNSATAFTGSSQVGATLLTPGTGLLVFTGWIVLAIVGAALVLTRRDA